MKKLFNSGIAWIVFLALTMIGCAVVGIATAQTPKNTKTTDTTYVWNHPNHIRCSAMTKGSGYTVQCKKTAVKGSTMCSIHQGVYKQHD